MTWKKIRDIWPASSQLVTCFQLARQVGPGLSQLWRFAWLCPLRAYDRPVKQFCSWWEWGGVEFKDQIWTSKSWHHVSLKASPPLPLAPNFKKGSCSKSVPLTESLPCTLANRWNKTIKDAFSITMFCSLLSLLTLSTINERYLWRNEQEPLHWDVNTFWGEVLTGLIYSDGIIYIFIAERGVLRKGNLGKFHFDANYYILM